MSHRSILDRSESHHIQRLRQFERSFPPVVPYSVIIIQPVREIRVFLNLRHNRIAAHGMYRAGRNKRYVSLSHLIMLQVLRQSAISDRSTDTRGIHLFVPSQIDCSMVRRRHDVPHLRFTQRVFMLNRILIVRVNLNREIVNCINELQEQRELVSEGLIYFTSHQLIHIDLQQILKRVTGMRTIRHHRRIFLNIRNDPCLADVLKISGHMVIPLGDSMSSP